MTTSYTECAVESCGARTRARGWCNPHYQRWLRWGSPTGAAPTRVERFWARVQKSDDGCWLWTGGRHSTGYGSDGGRLAHRVVYELLVGPIPRGLQLDHLCRVRLCVRPDHLEPVTQAENIQRGDSPSAIASRTGHCRRGHKLAGGNLYVVPKTGGRRCLACVDIRVRASGAAT